MANTKNKESLAYKNKLAYIKKRNKMMERLYIAINPSTEPDIVEWLKGRKKATYIKQLIRDDIARNS